MQTLRYGRILNCDAASLRMIRLLVTELGGLVPQCHSPRYAYDIHLREKSKLMVYHGGTCLLIIDLSHAQDGKIKFVSPSYGGSGEKTRSAGCAETFVALKSVQSCTDGSLGQRMAAFLQEALLTVSQKYFAPESEGFWSSKLSIDYGRHWTPSYEWLIIDREAVIGFKSSVLKEEFYQAKKAEALQMKQDILVEFPWSNGSTGFGDELDFLAIGRDQQLVCIELKHASNASGIYWGPLQTVVYRNAFQKTINELSEPIKNMVRQKVALGLLPRQAEQRLPEGTFQRVEGTLAVADADNYLQSHCWERAKVVNDRLSVPVKMVRSRSTGACVQWESFPR